MLPPKALIYCSGVYYILQFAPIQIGTLLGKNVMKTSLKSGFWGKSDHTNDMFFKGMFFSLRHRNEVGKKGYPSFDHQGEKGTAIKNIYS